MGIVIICLMIIVAIGVTLQDSAKDTVSKVGSTITILGIIALISVYVIGCMIMQSLNNTFDIVDIDKYMNNDNNIIYEVTYKDKIFHKTIWLTEDNYNQYIKDNKLVISDLDIQELQKAMFK